MYCKAAQAALVTYQLVVRLDHRAPAGYLAENLIVETNDPEKSLHLVPVTFVAPQVSGRVKTMIYIDTSLGAVTPVRAYADVTGP